METTVTMSTAGEEEEMCPICRASKYLNPDMQFLVNPECYHKMCESCVDRIFSVGPAPCPYKGCGKILRKGRFKKQVFDDIKVEKEVDVRQRVCKVYNRREDDFDSEAEYNDYLEKIEDIIFAIVAGGEKRVRAERELLDYEKQNKQEILQNALRIKQEDASNEELQRLETERKRKLRLLAIQLEDQERQISEDKHQELVSALAQAGSGREARKIEAEIEQRARERLAELRQNYEQEVAKPQYQPITSRTQKKVIEPVSATPFTPFAGDRQVQELWHLKDSYYDPSMEKASDPALRAGGFNARQAQAETLTLAFMGISVDIEAEKSSQNSAITVG